MEVACFTLRDFPAWIRGELSPRHTLIGIHQKGRIVSASAALRRAGLRTEEHLERARALFPEGRFYPRDPALEEAMWEDLLLLLNSIAPHLKSLRPGWALLQPWDINAFKSLGASLHAGMGVAHAPSTAMIAALQAEPGGIVEVPERSTTEFLARSPVALLVDLGFAEETVERLTLFGLITVGAVEHLSRRHLQAQFGESEGGGLFRFLHPDTDVADRAIPLYQPPPVIKVSHRFEGPAEEPGEVAPLLRELIRQGSLQLGGLLVQRLTVRLHRDNPLQNSRHDNDPSAERERRASRVLKAPTAQPRAILTNAEILLRSLLSAGYSVSKIDLELGALVQPTVIQGDLFFNRNDLYEAVKQIHRRYPNVLFRAVIVDPDAYLPENAVRLESYPDIPPEQPRSRRTSQRRSGRRG